MKKIKKICRILLIFITIQTILMSFTSTKVLATSSSGYVAESFWERVFNKNKHYEEMGTNEAENILNKSSEFKNTINVIIDTVEWAGFAILLSVVVVFIMLTKGNNLADKLADKKKILIPIVIVFLGILFWRVIFDYIINFANSLKNTM